MYTNLCASGKPVIGLQVRIDVDSEQPTELQIKLVASLLSAEQLAGITAWDPRAAAKPEAITNGVLEQTLLCNQADAINSMTGRRTYHGSCYMTFKGATSSASPLWGPFTCPTCYSACKHADALKG